MISTRVLRLLAPFFALTLCGRLTAAQGEATPAGPLERDVGVVYYDWVENGALRGGVLALDPNDPLLAPQPASAYAGVPVTTIVDNGPVENRIDLVFVGDGYTAPQLGSYASQVQGILPVFFGEAPLDAYASYFNVHRVDVVSVESGVDNDPVQGILRQTAMDMAYWCSNIERLLCISTGKAAAFAANAPDVDQILALANSTKYGGAGYPGFDLGTLAAANSSAIEVALHEFGHSFANLADEYDYGGSTTWGGGEPSTENVSILTAAEMALAGTKWSHWLSEPNVGTFEGANYSVFGIYRPTNNSLMRNLGRPFEQVNVERFIVEMYKVVDPIDDATPAGEYGLSESFFVDPIDPVSHALSVRWLLDGTPLPGATGTSFDAGTLGLASGTYTLSVEVVDETPLVRDAAERATHLREVRSWTLSDAGQVTIFGCSAPVGSLVVLAGGPVVGTSLTLGIENPFGVVSPGAIPVLALSLAAAPGACGIPLGTAFSMQPGVGGQLLVHPGAAFRLKPNLIGAPYAGPGNPAPIVLALPNDPSLAGVHLFVQGLLYEPANPFGVELGLSRAADITIGL